MERQRLNALFEEYAAYHENPVNRLAHMFGFPLIFTATFGLADHVGLGLPAFLAFTAANVATEWRLAIAAAILVLPLWWLGAVLPTFLLWPVLFVGVAVPIMGHVVFEGRWPDTAARFARFEVVGHLWFIDRFLHVVQE